MSQDSDPKGPRPETAELFHVGDIEEIAQLIEDYCYHRHTQGAAEYGPLTFLENDMYAMTLEELADARNYLKYQMIKILLLARAAQDQTQLAEPLEMPPVGARAFMPLHPKQQQSEGKDTEL